MKHGFEYIQQGVRSIVLTAFLCLLAACATLPENLPDVPELRGQPGYDIDSVDLLGLSTEMKQFVSNHLDSRPRGQGRAWTLTYAALDPYLLAFDYDPSVTLSAKEAFRARRGNCLTFSNLFIAMAREAGLDAWYREVQIPAQWNSVDDTLLVSMHVNAAVREYNEEYIIDVSRRKTSPDERSRRLNDREAEAQFYNNLGADALVGGDLAMAYAYFRKANQTLPGLAYVWSNLGVVLRRNGQTDDALLAYHAALAIKPDETVALNNIYTIYEEAGEMEAALEIQARVERIRRRNPYYLLHLAEVAGEEARWDDAIGLLKRAIRIEGGEYRFYYELAQAQFQAGKPQLAQSSLREARKRVPPGFDEGPLALPPDD